MMAELMVEMTERLLAKKMATQTDQDLDVLTVSSTQWLDDTKGCYSTMLKEYQWEQKIAWATKSAQ